MVVDRLALWSRTDPNLARTAWWGLSLAGVAGFRALVPLPGGFIRMVGPAGRQCVLGAASLGTPRHEMGEPDDLDRLVAALATAMGRRKHILHIRRPIPPALDAEPVARAVQLWLRAIDRGEWHGRHAVYEDEGLSLEISLVDAPLAAEGQRTLLFLVPPVVGMERIREVYQILMDAAFSLDEAVADLPMVLTLGANPAWRISQGHILQTLYGLPDIIGVSPGQRARTRYGGGGLALFADPGYRRLASVWWAEPMGLDPLQLRAWAHDNPWAEAVSETPEFPGRHYGVQALQPSSYGRAQATMRWGGAVRPWGLAR